MYLAAYPGRRYDALNAVGLDDALLTAEEAELRGHMREFATRHVAPHAAQADENHRLDPQVLKHLKSMGLFGLTVSEDHGGREATRVEFSVVVEEIARACASSAMTLMANAHTVNIIERFGTAEQRRRWLPDIALGRSIAAVLLTEPEAGTDVTSITSTARRRGSSYVLNARKTFVTNGDLADTFVVYAKLRDSDSTCGEIAPFVLRSNIPGVSVGPPFRKLGLRASSTNEVVLEDVAVPGEDQLGERGGGVDCVLLPLDGARLSTAAQAVGIAQRAFELCQRYCLERVQSGKVIAHHQAVQLRLADMRIDLSAARSLLYAAARSVDAGAGTPGAAAMTKVFCTRTASEISSQAVELIGGYGFMEEFELARLLRDAKGGQIYDGTNDVNRLLLARQMIKEA